MSAHRMVTVRTKDHGDVTVPEPSWCLGGHPAGGYREDIEHAGAERLLYVPTACHGPVAVARAGLMQRPFSPSDPAPRAVIEFDEVHEFDAAGVTAVGDALAAFAAGPLAILALQLRALEDGGRP